MQLSYIIGLIAASSILVEATPTGSQRKRATIPAGEAAPVGDNGNDSLVCNESGPKDLVAVDNLDKLRQDFCNKYDGTVIPIGHELSALLTTTDVNNNPTTLIGSIRNDGTFPKDKDPNNMGVQTGYAVQARECLDLTSWIVKPDGDESKNTCVQGSQTAGGSYTQNTWGVTFEVAVFVP